MTIEERVKFIINKYPNVSSEEEFMWRYAENFFDVSVYMLKKQFLEFWKESQIVVDQVLPIMHETHENKEEKPEPKFENTLNEKDKEDFKYVFGDKDYKEETQEKAQEEDYKEEAKEDINKFF
jgi:hypothetical protein